MAPADRPDWPRPPWPGRDVKPGTHVESELSRTEAAVRRPGRAVCLAGLRPAPRPEGARGGMERRRRRTRLPANSYWRGTPRGPERDGRSFDVARGAGGLSEARAPGRPAAKRSREPDPRYPFPRRPDRRPPHVDAGPQDAAPTPRQALASRVAAATIRCSRTQEGGRTGEARP